MTVRVYPLIRGLFGPMEGEATDYPDALRFHIDENTRTLHLTGAASPHALASYVDGRWARAEVVALPPAETFPRNGAEARLAREASALAHMVNAALDAAPSGRLWQPAGAPADMDAAAPGVLVSTGNADSLRNLAGFVIETLSDPADTDGPSGVGCYPPAEVVRPAQSFDAPPPADGEFEVTRVEADAWDYFGGDYSPPGTTHPDTPEDAARVGALVAFRAGWTRGEAHGHRAAAPEAEVIDWTPGLPGVRGMDAQDAVLDSTDPTVWAETFRKALDGHPDALTPGFLAAWFDNAIEAGRLAARRQDADEPARPGLAEDTIVDAVPPGEAPPYPEPDTLAAALRNAIGPDAVDHALDGLAPAGSGQAFRLAVRAASRVADLPHLIRRIEQLSGQEGEVTRVRHLLEAEAAEHHRTRRYLAEERASISLRYRPALRIGSPVSVEDGEGKGATGTVTAWTASPGGTPFVIVVEHQG